MRNFDRSSQSFWSVRIILIYGLNLVRSDHLHYIEKRSSLDLLGSFAASCELFRDACTKVAHFSICSSNLNPGYHCQDEFVLPGLELLLGYRYPLVNLELAAGHHLKAYKRRICLKLEYWVARMTTYPPLSQDYF